MLNLIRSIRAKGFLLVTLFIASYTTYADEGWAFDPQLNMNKVLAEATIGQPFQQDTVVKQRITHQEIKLDIPSVSIDKPELNIQLDLNLGALPTIEDSRLGKW